MSHIFLQRHHFRLIQLMVADNYADKGIQQSHTTRKELTLHLSLSFRMDTLSTERELKLEIHTINLRN